MRTIERDIVGALIISKDGHILLGKSRKGGVFQGLWLVPGGGVDPGESKIDALFREILEETGIDISHLKPKLVSDSSVGESQKTLKETSETANVKMRYFDYKVEIDKPAREIKFSPDDDIEKLAWIPLNKLSVLKLSPTTKHLLTELKLIV